MLNAASITWISQKHIDELGFNLFPTAEAAFNYLVGYHTHPKSKQALLERFGEAALPRYSHKGLGLDFTQGFVINLIRLPENGLIATTTSDLNTETTLMGHRDSDGSYAMFTTDCGDVFWEEARYSQINAHSVIADFKILKRETTMLVPREWRSPHEAPTKVVFLRRPVADKFAPR